MRRGPGKKPSAMHAGLVGERALVGTPYLRDEKLRAQYAAEIAPRTAVMLTKILDQQLPLLRPKRVLDLGAGTGIVGTTLSKRFEGVQVVAVDRVAGPGMIVADLSKGARPAGVTGRFDLIVAAHLLNEFTGLLAPARAELVLGWMRDWLAPNGVLLLIEPALKETSRALLSVRDQLTSAGAFVLAPCLWQGPCPALVSPHDWCHDSAARPSQPRADFSYLVLAAQGQVHNDPAQFRVVSDLKREKGRTRLFGCGLSGRNPMLLQNRDATPSNEAFLSLDRGDLFRVVGLGQAGDGLRLTSETVVRVVGGHG
jgi:SAM-dependent methyltransferase